MNFIEKLGIKGESRSAVVKKNILGSFANKGISIVLSLLIIPMTINYVNATKYGIWLTLSSIISWISYFDLGFAHGFRNRFAEARANGENGLARKYVSTTYAVLIIIFSIIFIIAFVINSFISWGEILNIDKQMDPELMKVFAVLICFFCLQIVVNVFTILLLADQKPAFSSTINTVGQFVSLICIYILTKTTDGNLIYLAFALSGIPCIVLLFVSIVMYSTRYRQFSPSLKTIDFKLTPNIIGLGIKFFVIQIAMLFTFQFSNIILSRILGPDSVTEYNVAYKYFSIVYMIYIIFLTPMWSAFTDAYTKQDFQWMNKVYGKLSKAWWIIAVAAFFMLVISPWVYKIWLGDAVSVSFSLSLMMALYVLMLSRANLYMYLINGTGKVTVQMLVYVSFSLISIPAMIICCNIWGIVGILFISFLVYLIQDVVGYIQLKKIMGNKAIGIWNK